MGTTAWKFAQTATGWTNSGNVSADDGVLATVGSLGAGGYSAILNAYNFGFTTDDVPTGSTIQGVEIRVKWRRLAGYAVGVQYALLRFSWGGNDGNNKSASVPAISNSLTSFTLGGAADLWGATVLSSADGDDEVRSTNFGFTFRIFNADAKYSMEMGVDCVECRVTYTPPAAAPTVTNNTASGVFGEGGTVQMAATESPTSWSLPGSPPTGVSINSSGLVTWTSATPAAVHTITVRATNATGDGDGTLTLTITDPPAPAATGPTKRQLGGALWMMGRRG